MLGFLLWSLVLTVADWLIGLLPANPLAPVEWAPEYLRFLGVLMELNAAFPVGEFVTALGLLGSALLVLAVWKLVSIIKSLVPTWGGLG